MTKKRNRLVNYTSMIATIGTVVLAITALITVYITISGWKEEQEANRPYFTFKDSPRVIFEENLEFEIQFTNVGEHPAVSLWSKSIVFSSDLDSYPIAIDEFALVNDIPKNASTTLVIGLDTLRSLAETGNVKPYFIVIFLKYEDPIIEKQFEQSLYMKWSGIVDKKILLTNHAEEEEKQQIINYFNEHGISF
ncbi:MAG: hypothetical protein GX351_10240 [Peptococcaceae bacterium]|nr:hypothetical protein [Peptococcaceae bacterium]